MTPQRPSHGRSVLAALATLLFAGAPAFPANPSAGYSETVEVLSGAYNGEVRARNGYAACARQAGREGYPNIAYLFSALSASEAVHAANFRRILSALGKEVKEPPPEDGTSRRTRESLKAACDHEIEEIDRTYPALLAKTRPEGHEEALRFLTYAWESEKQHRDLLKEIESGTGIFFGTLARRIEGTKVTFLVCANCGSTVTGRPKGRCPVCGGPPSGYEELNRLIPFDMK